MAQKPELNIKVGVEPQVDKKELQSKIQTKVDEINKSGGVSLKVNVDAEDFAKDITANLEKSLNGIDGTATKTYKNLGKNLRRVLGEINTNLAAQIHTLTDSLNTLMTGKEFQIKFRSNASDAVNAQINNL